MGEMHPGTNSWFAQSRFKNATWVERGMGSNVVFIKKFKEKIERIYIFVQNFIFYGRNFKEFQGVFNKVVCWHCWRIWAPSNGEILVKI